MPKKETEDKNKTTTRYNVDFHCHATLRALYTRSKKKNNNMWDVTTNPTSQSSAGRWARIQTAEIAKDSQANLLAYAESNTRVVFDNLYPVEKGWFNFRKFPAFVVGKKSSSDVLQAVTGIDVERLNHVLGLNSYFEELKEKYAFVKKGQNKGPGDRYYRIAKDYKSLIENLKDPNCISLVMNIEGAHALESGSELSATLSPRKHKTLLRKNIEELKSWEHPPFYITLAHHFSNGLSGHSRSFKPPINLVFNQNEGIDKGITDIGWYVIDDLLTRNNGRRILIDIKHMSITARKQFYEFVQRNNYINTYDQIPIVCSHTGVNGYKTMAGSMRKPDTGNKMRGAYFHNWSINLSDEELLIIHKSQGLIGIMLDKGLLGGPDTLHRISQMRDSQRQKNAFLRLILDNIFHGIVAINEKSAWDMFCLASDFDGLITHIDFYPTAASIDQLKIDLIAYLKEKRYQEEYWFGYTPDRLMTKFMQTNTMDFLKKHFK